MENVTEYHDIICEFALRTFNLLDRVVSFPWLLYEFKVVYVQGEKYSICSTTTQMKNTLSKIKIRENY